MRHPWYLLLPLIVALLIAGLWLGAHFPAPFLYLRADLPSLVVLMGFLASLIWAVLCMVEARCARLGEARLARAVAEQVDAHQRFLRRLDHELKNPLTAIRAGLANAVTANANPALTSVRGQVDRLARLGADLRKLADLETRPIECEPVAIDEVLSELLETAQERSDVGGRRLHLNLPTAPWPLPPVSGDRDLLFLALHNLLDNALKFTCADDTVELRAFEDGTWVAVEVADTGPGIPEDDLPHVGEELYRGTGARSVEGSGLGLALARAIVSRHDGNLAIRSRLGQGTVVTLRLPAARVSPR